LIYHRSNLDKKNTKWFCNDNTKASLIKISLHTGNIRGLKPFNIEFEYPISAIAGSNGSGKSTILAISACAFHNLPNAYIPPLRKQSYYTFKDFFIQSDEETPIQGIRINYGIRYNNWRGKDKEGLKNQSRIKRKSGRWNDYKTRVPRNVIYFGVQRVVPHFERSVHKSYKSRFKPGNLPEDIKKRIAEIASRIIGKTYTKFDSYQHAKYILPVVSSSGISYSGFNMGAGESAIFEILTALFQAGAGTLIIIDEIELGLHDKAQQRLIEQLKALCFELKCQIICSTHSYSIINNLPPEARFFIEQIENSTVITKGISADFACGKMGKIGSEELDIFVEDKNAATIVEQILSLDSRKRCKIHAIGSHGAVIRQLTSRYLEKIDNCICVLDGDQSDNFDEAIKSIANNSEASTTAEKDKVTEWAKDRLFYLPGKVWPEKWLLETAITHFENPANDDLDNLAKAWGVDSKDEVLSFLKEANLTEKHNEFFELSNIVKLDVNRIREDLCRCVLLLSPNSFSELINSIQRKLP
jgi:predicted ATPase